MTLKVNIKYLHGEVREIRAVAKADLDEGEVTRQGGTWGFTPHAVTKGEEFSLIIHAGLIEMDKTTALRKAKAGHMLVLTPEADPKSIKCVAGQQTISRTTVGIIFDDPERSTRRVKAIWGLI